MSDRGQLPDGVRVALAHDYLTQLGGAERVVLDIAKAFPAAPIFTSLYEPTLTYPEYRELDVRPSTLNRFGLLRAHHRAALPFLARTVSRMTVDSDVLVASSSGWAHGMKTTGKKIIYCHAPARWLYQARTYLGGTDSTRGLADRIQHAGAATGLAALSGPLRKWDRKAAASADLYLANSTVTRSAVKAAYGIDAQILPPPRRCSLPVAKFHFLEWCLASSCASPASFPTRMWMR